MVAARDATSPAATAEPSSPWTGGSGSPVNPCRGNRLSARLSRRRASAALIRGETDLWRGYDPLSRRIPHLAMSRVSERRDIFPVFRHLFGRKAA